MLKKRKASGKPALDTVSIFLARSMNSFLISSVLLPPLAAAGAFWVAFCAVAPGVFSALTALLALAFDSLLLLGVEVTAAAGVSLLSCAPPSCWRDKEEEEEQGEEGVGGHRLFVNLFTGLASERGTTPDRSTKTKKQMNSDFLGLVLGATSEADLQTNTSCEALKRNRQCNESLRVYLRV